MKKTAIAVWTGTGKEGSGQLTTQSGVLQENAYSFATRFEDARGTNPEELLAAAHAGCFSMKLSFVLTGAGFPPTKLTTSAAVELKDGKISESALELKAEVPGISEEDFQKYAQEAKDNCPVSVLFNTNITLNAQLVNN